MMALSYLRLNSICFQKIHLQIFINLAYKLKPHSPLPLQFLYAF